MERASRAALDGGALTWPPVRRPPFRSAPAPSRRQNHFGFNGQPFPPRSSWRAILRCTAYKSPGEPALERLITKGAYLRDKHLPPPPPPPADIPAHFVYAKRRLFAAPCLPPVRRPPLRSPGASLTYRSGAGSLGSLVKVAVSRRPPLWRFHWRCFEEANSKAATARRARPPSLLEAELAS